MRWIRAWAQSRTDGSCLGGPLSHRHHGSKAPLDAIFSPGEFEDTPEYSKWLETDTAELDRLEAARHLVFVRPSVATPGIGSRPMPARRRRATGGVLARPPARG
jgi:hypothetical protein